MAEALQEHDQPDVAALTDVDRRALATLWTMAARAGTADVTGLAELVLVLTALGAPPPLVQRAAACAGVRAGSVAGVTALATAYRGTAPEVLPVPALLAVPPGGVRRPARALRRLALRALRDGLLVSGHAAQVTGWAAATCGDPAVRTVLSDVCRAEAGAAAVWGDVLDWALVQRPRLVARLRRLDLAETSPLAERPAGSAPVVLAAHGWPRVEEVARLYAAHRAGVLARLASYGG